MEMECGIKKCAMLIMKSTKKNNGRNRTATLGKNQNAWRKGDLQVLGNIRSGHRQTIGDDRKNKNSVLQKNEKPCRNKTLQQKFH